MRLEVGQPLSPVRSPRRAGPVLDTASAAQGDLRLGRGRIEAMRREHTWSAHRITFELVADETAISRRSVTRHLRRLGLNRHRFIDPTGVSNRVPQRITARRPGHMVHLDVKKAGRIPDGGGWRAHGRDSETARAVARTKQRGSRTGYVYQHSAVDGFSRLAYTEALPDEKASTTIALTHRA